MSIIDTLKPVAANIGRLASQHITELSVGVGIAGMITAIFQTAHASKKAEAKLAEVQESRKRVYMDEVTQKWITGDPDPLTSSEVLKIKAPYYIPVALTAAGSAACIIFGTHQSLKRNALLTTALTVSDQAFRDYKKSVEEQIKEIVPEEKIPEVKQKIQDKVAKKAVDASKTPAPVAIANADGKLLCYERYSGRYFYSTMEDVKRACNDLNRQMRDDNYISLNEFYYEVGLEETALGHELGWHIDRGYIDPTFGSTLTADNRLAMTVDFEIPPRTDFRHVL